MRKQEEQELFRQRQVDKDLLIKQFARDFGFLDRDIRNFLEGQGLEPMRREDAMRLQEREQQRQQMRQQQRQQQQRARIEGEYDDDWGLMMTPEGSVRGEQRNDHFHLLLVKMGDK